MRPIDADALLQRWNNLLPRMSRDKDGAVPIDFCLAIHEVSATPALTLDALRLKGRWESKFFTTDRQRVCSICNCTVRQPSYDKGEISLFKYCPHCGSDMRGGGEG